MKGREGRFPVGLTLAALIVFAICVGLGVWQLQRAAWKARVLGQIAARAHAPPAPIGPVLARAARGEDVGFTRVVANCQPSPPTATSFQAGADNGGWIWRATAPCPLAGAVYAGVLVERGSLDASRGSTIAPTVTLGPLREVEGVLRPAPPNPGAATARFAPYILVAEREAPPVPGVTPTRFADAAPESLQYVGAYAPTWFGLAGVLAGVYAALLWRRLRP
jgi:surfeit locus 1 family protein